MEIKDGLCVLPLNIINEKMFIFIWFWLVLVAVVSGVFLLYRLAVLMGPQIRVALITVKGGKSTKRSDVEAILDPEVSLEQRLSFPLKSMVYEMKGLSKSFMSSTVQCPAEELAV